MMQVPSQHCFKHFNMLQIAEFVLARCLISPFSDSTRAWQRRSSRKEELGLSAHCIALRRPILLCVLGPYTRNSFSSSSILQHIFPLSNHHTHLYLPSPSKSRNPQPNKFDGGQEGVNNSAAHLEGTRQVGGREKATASLPFYVLKLHAVPLN